jgi:predicted aspartyl protease
MQGTHALVDTGASLSCIDNALAAALNLPVVDRVTLAGSAGAHEVNMYLGQIFVPELRTTYYGSFAGVDLAAGGQHHVVLIGRDILQHVRLVYDGHTGKVTITATV